MNGALVPGLKLDRAALDRARTSRDARFDGRFFIAVLSTKIYCRPICPAPTCRPENIRYYATASAAAEAGFRPCLRCRPEAAPASPAWLGASAVVRRALRLIEEGALDDASVSELALRLGIGSRHLRRLFVKHVGASPIAVAQTRRLHFAKRLIDETNLAMTEVALASGYSSVRRFNAAFRASYRRTPSDLRRRRRGSVASPDDGIVLRLAFRPPYDWSGLMQYLAARAVAGIERIDNRGYARTIEVDGKPAAIAVRYAADINAVEFGIHGAPAAALFNLVSRARRMFDLSLDPASLAQAFDSDRLLAPLVKRYPGMRIPGAWDGFECAVRAVLGDGSPTAEQALVSRLVRHSGERIRTSTLSCGALTHLFPGPAAIATADLKGAGLAASRIRSLKDLAEAVLDGRVDFTSPADELVAALVQSAWLDQSTAQYVALRAQGEPDAFPAGHPVLLRSMAAMAIGGAGAQKRRGAVTPAGNTAEGWRPWRSYAALLLWRADAEHTEALVSELRATGSVRTAAAERPGPLWPLAPAS